MADSLVVTFEKMGELSSIITIISPLPSFLMCKKSNDDKVKMLKGISLNYLLSLWVMNACWVAYAIKADLEDIIAINLIGMISALLFIFIYLFVKS
jgi:uncharacterized protein with PQ loop repeat